MKQMSDLFTQHRYFKFQNEIQFFILQQWNIQTSRFRKLLWLQYAYKLFFHVLHDCIILLHDRSLLMSWHNIVFTFFSNLGPI